MPPVIRPKDKHHCFMANPKTFDLRNLSRLADPGSFALEDFGLRTDDFDGLPDRPPDFVEEGLLRPFSHIDRQSSTDAGGEHTFWLLRLKPSAVTLLAGLADDQVENFAQRWSAGSIYTPLQQPKNITSDVADRTPRDETLWRLHMFLSFFCCFCRRALAEKKDIYVLRERHEYRAP